MSKQELIKELKKSKRFSILRLLSEADKLKIKYKLVHKKGNNYYFRLSSHNKDIYLWNDWIFYSLDLYSSSLSSHKHFVKKILNEKQIKTPQGFIVTKFNEIKPLLKKYKLEFPLVLKPDYTGEGFGVIANIPDWPSLQSAWEQVANLKSRRKKTTYIIEEYIPYRDFRVLVLKNKVIACSERVHPYIKGDGKSNIQQLIKKQLRTEGVCGFNVDWEVKRNLTREKVSLKTVLEKDRVIRLRQNSNVSNGALSVNRTKDICPKFKKIAIQAAKEFDLKLCGVDILTEDIASSNSDYRVLEINFGPGLNNHLYPDIGRPEPVLKKILKAIFNIK